MQDREGRRGETSERAARIEIADERDDTMRAKLAHIVRISRQSDQSHAVPQEVCDAYGDIAAPHQQQPLRHDLAD